MVKLYTIIVFQPLFARQHKLKKYSAFFPFFVFLSISQLKFHQIIILRHCPNRWGPQLSGNIKFMYANVINVGEEESQSPWMHGKVSSRTKIGGVKKKQISSSGPLIFFLKTCCSLFWQYWGQHVFRKKFRGTEMEICFFLTPEVHLAHNSSYSISLKVC